MENLGVDAGVAANPEIEVRSVVDPRMEAVMRTLERIGDIIEWQTQERAAPVAQAVEAVAVANENQGQGQVVANRPMHQLVEQFIKLKPPKFFGKGDPEAAPRWVEELKKAFEVLECNDHEKVTLAVYQLQDNANDWWKATRDRIFPKGTAKTWAVFTESFYEKYFSASARERKLAEFMRLRQGQMTVDQYKAEFARLSKFAPRMVEHPEDKARRFLDGLRADIRSQLLLVNLGTYEQIFDKAQILERDQMDRAAVSGSKFVQGWNNRNPGKRPMVDNRRFTPPVKRNIGKPIQIGNGPCRICGGRHGNGPCPTRGGACFGCGGFGHHIKNCPNSRQNRPLALPPPRNENRTGVA
ncbi:uncharacterized protein LOC130136110 [Syzygium oleosum]|uniref:uncharacterized protein LOC130136110 n=1 Tax=Syzygium oleosum TaxID=219896 RepID=UPI0024BA390E|nr:uncharacterized protein LOC130136110 [Syzygium oleosum]